MNKTGEIVIIEDDEDDQELLREVFTSLNIPNEVVFFKDGDVALEHLIKDHVMPFLILSDINLPKLNGLELKRMIHTNDRISSKCIPYLFFTTGAAKRHVTDAYTMSAQGFFVKPNSYEEIKSTVKTILDYWQKCSSPNDYE